MSCGAVRIMKSRQHPIMTSRAPMSETEGAALQFFVCRTSNDYQDRMASSEGSWVNHNKKWPVTNLS